MNSGPDSAPEESVTRDMAPVPLPRGPGGASGASWAGFTLPEGSEIGRRYRVVGLLGRGGMGAVYHAWDLELERDVALKLISPEISTDSDVIERFKREIQLSSRITHRNVLRVYDLGEADGTRFLTMQFVAGEDLAGYFRREGCLPVERIVGLFRQICLGLAAAHEQGVVHRDLKPQNIMVDGSGTVLITDFGLAKSLGTTGVTQLGSLLGTPAYMSPEQVKGQAVDRRSDIYSLGVVLYELLTATTPFTGGSVYEVMIRRLTTPPRPVGSINPTVPEYLRKILERCLAADPAARYQSVEEILADLDAGGYTTSVRFELTRRRGVLKAVAVAVGLAIVVSGAWWASRRLGHRDAAPEARSVLVADFENRTGDPVFDGTLETAFTIALEDASFLTTYGWSWAEIFLAGTPGLPEKVARLVAAREGVGVVTSGSVETLGQGYRVHVVAEDAATGKQIVAADADTPGKNAVLGAVAALASKVRGALGDQTPESARLAAAETFSAGSFDAAHDYAVAQDAAFAGKWDDAIRGYEKAIRTDPNMGRAYAGLAAAYTNTGRREEARQAFENALSRLERMSDREKFRTRGLYYVTVRKPEKAVEELKNLVAQYPSDTNGIANLALAHFYRRDMAQALVVGRRFTEIYPKAVPQRNNVGLFAMYGGDFEAAIREQKTVLDLNPKFHLALVGLALSQLASDRPDDARRTWETLAALDAHGASLAAMGLADVALAAGKPAEAVPLLEKGAAADLEAKDADAAAGKLVALAEALLALGREKPALAAAEKAATLSRGENILFPAARVFLAAGKAPRALELAAELGKRLESDPRAYGKLIEGEALLKDRKAREAIGTIETAKGIADTWIGRFDLGRAYLEAEALTEADAELERCARRRGEATAAFLDESPTWRLWAPVLYWRGRAQEGLKSPSASDSFRAFLALRPDAGDPLVADARRRLEASK